MPALDGIEYKEINGIKVDKENDTCFFNDETHSYWVQNAFQRIFLV